MPDSFTKDEPRLREKEDPDDSGDLRGINSPELDEKTGKPKRKAVSGFKHANAISKRMHDAAKHEQTGRLATAAVVAGKYNGDAPYKMSDLARTAQLWRNNFSTNPLASVVDRAKPQLTDPIKQTEFLTYSTLSIGREDGAEKTRKFRLRITRLIRSWTGWVEFIDGTAQEVYLYGGGVPAWVDDDWKPQIFGTDEVFLPSGSKQHALKISRILIRQPMLLHDFLEKLHDKEIAIDANYDWEGCVKTVNEIAGAGHNLLSDDSPFHQVDAQREGADQANDMDTDEKVVWMYHLLAREYNGGVHLWTTSEKGGHAIRHVKDLHENMEGAATLFTLQTGNRKFYGSKGAGRMLANLHIAIDRSRNLGQDQIYLGGLPIVLADDKDLNTIQPVVRHPFILLPKSCELSKEQVKFDWQAFKFMDDSLVRNMEAIAGAFIPPKLDNTSSSNTKIEAAQRAERELAIRNGVLGRFFGQFAELISTMQQKICKPENLKEASRIYEQGKEQEQRGIRVLAVKVYKWMQEVIGKGDKNSKPQEQSRIADSDAVEALVDLLKDGLTVEDIVELAISPAGNNIEEQGEERDQKTVAFIEAKQQHPMFNQRAMAQMEAQIQIGEDRAQRILLTDVEDPNIEAVAIRTQRIEFGEMMAGQEMPVSSLDTHRIHRQELLQLSTPVIQSLETAPTPETSAAGKLIVDHFADHIQMDMESTEQQKEQALQGLEGWKQIILNADKMLEKLAEQAAKAGVQGGPGALPPQINGVPIQAAGQPNGAIAGTDGDLDRTKLLTDTIQRGHEIENDKSRIELEHRKLDQKDEQETLKMATAAMQDVANKSSEAQRQGLSDAQADLQAQNAEPKV